MGVRFPRGPRRPARIRALERREPRQPLKGATRRLKEPLVDTSARRRKLPGVVAQRYFEQGSSGCGFESRLRHDRGSSTVRALLAMRLLPGRTFSTARISPSRRRVHAPVSLLASHYLTWGRSPIGSGNGFRNRTVQVRILSSLLRSARTRLGEARSETAPKREQRDGSRDLSQARPRAENILPVS